MIKLKINGILISEDVESFSMGSNGHRHQQFRGRGGSVFLAHQSPSTLSLKLTFIDSLPLKLIELSTYCGLTDSLTIIHELVTEYFTGETITIFKNVSIIGIETLLNVDEPRKIIVLFEATAYEIIMSPTIQKLFDLNDKINCGEIFIGNKEDYDYDTN